jgi:hypothetical protein
MDFKGVGFAENLFGAMIIDMEQLVNRIARYFILARVSEGRARPFVRDKLLLVAASLATRGLLPKTAAACRYLILSHNPQHAVSRYDTMEQALRDTEFQPLLKRAEQQYPTEHAEVLLLKLGIDLDDVRRAHPQARECLAFLLQIPPDNLDDCLD